MDLTATRARVLVVEDDPGVSSLFARILSGAGYVVETAPGFSAARELLERQPPDVFLLDVMLPETDGFSICKWLKDNANTRLTPVILVTALGDRESRISGRRAGADDYLQKPVDPEELIARVASAARLKRYTDDLDSAASIVMTLAVMIEARDGMTEGHCHRMANYATAIGRALGLGPDTVIGDELCGNLRSLQAVRPIVRHHHERRDGAGYPDGLRSSKPSLEL